MGVNISYMGTKKDLAPSVVEVIQSAQKGIFLDVFAGMCSVGEAIGTSRQVWTNDIQRFSYEVGSALFTSNDQPLNSVITADIHHCIYEERMRHLSNAVRSSIVREIDVLSSTSYSEFSSLREKLHTALEADLLSFQRQEHSLFLEIYSNTYFGVLQCAEIDAIFGCISYSCSNRLISEDHRRWLLISLGRAMLRVSTSTGHFAQFLKPKETSYRTFIRQRKRSVWSEWLLAAEEMSVVGTSAWRSANKSFNKDCLDLLRNLKKSKIRPSVIYADPPYTDDQYSRYYHILDTLCLYDYPSISGEGRYRPNRFRTPFSIKKQSVAAMSELVQRSFESGADLVLSYPTNGLLYECDSDPETIMREYFPKVECAKKISHSHSTFGASKGEAKSYVTEQIFLGRQ